MITRFDFLDARITNWMARHGVPLLRISLGIVFLWFGALTPLVLFPGEVFTRIPYAPTLEGQYIIKNAVLVSAAIVIGATVRGGGLVAEKGSQPARVV